MKKKVNKSKQIPPKKGEATRGRQAAFIEAYANSRFNISVACRSIGIGRSTFYKWGKGERFRRELDDAIQGKIDMVEAALVRNIQAGDTTAIIFFLKTIGKTRGYIEGEKTRVGEVPAKRAVEILDALLAGVVDTVKAALMFEKAGLPLPDAVKVLLGKQVPETPPPDIPPSLSDDELEIGYQKEMARIDQQEKEWLPERRIDIQELKDELKHQDSFKPDAKTTIREK